MQTGRKKLSAFMAFFLVFAMLFSMVPSISSYADEPSAEDTTKPKIINVVFDDSRSMYMNQLTTWCQAKYALEVFTAMMGEKDTINIYPMSYFDESAGTDKITTVKGGKDSKAAVKEVHNMNSNYWGTPIESIDGAAEALAKENADKYDLWLVILTDGEKFYVDGKEQSTSETQRLLKEKLNTYAEQFNVAYLAIGDNPKNIEKTNPSNGLNSYTANGKNGEILTRVTEIANLIFQYQLLPNSLIKQSGSTYSLDVDIPTTQIIAFAQGENVSISNMKLDGDTLKGSDVTVKFSDVLPIDGQTKKTAANVVTDESLKGVITRYNAQSSNKPFKAGTYTVDISGADAKNVQFYYKPGVKATCQLLFMDGNVVDPNEGIVEGDYKVSFAFVNPLNNQAVTSKYGLLEQVGTPENHIYNNDTELDISGEIVHLAEGTVTITTTVNLIGKLKLTAREKYNVKKESVNIEIRFGIPEGAYKAHQLGEAATPVIATIYDLKTGAPLTREQWEECKVTIEGEKDEKLITWDIKKGSDVGTYEIRPILKNEKKVTSVSAGKYSFTVSATLKYEKKMDPATDTKTGAIEIAEYAGSTIVFEQTEIATPIRVPAISEFEGIPVTAYLVDEETGVKTVISEELWNELKVRCESPKTKRVSWSLEKGDKVGTYIVKPAYPWGLKLFMYGAMNGRKPITPEITAPDGVVIKSASDIFTTLSGNAIIGPMIYSGSGTIQMMVAPLTLAEIWKLIMWYVIGTALFLFFLIGYLTKNHIPPGAFKPAWSLKGKVVFGDKPHKIFWSVILPYVDERAYVVCSKGAMKVSAPDILVIANSNTTFKIGNVSEVIGGKPLIICSKPYTNSQKDQDKLSNMMFNYKSFTLQNIPKTGHVVGMFYMVGKNKNGK